MTDMNQYRDGGAPFILASLVSGYLDERALESIGLILEDALLFSRGRPMVQEPMKVLAAKLNGIIGDRVAADDVQSEYIDLFDRGRSVTSLYETEYGRARAMVKGTQLVEIAGFYQAFGFETGGEGVQAEMIDHISVEFEFYALLCMKFDTLVELNDREGMEIVLDGRKKFLSGHLGKYIAAISERPGVQASTYFSSVFNYCRELVMDECRKLEVEVEAEKWLEEPVVGEEMNCGGSVSLDFRKSWPSPVE